MRTLPALASLLIVLISLYHKGYAQNASALTYYVKSMGSDGDGLSDEMAWSFAKLNSTFIPPGSIVLFRRGDIFRGELKVNSGATNAPITYGAYGQGADPIISGLSNLQSWNLYSGGIYWAPVDVPELNVVLLDGHIQGMGRYPKTGYITYTGHSGNSSLVSSATIPFNPVGAEVVIRKIRQITDRHLVTAYTGNTIGLSSVGTYNSVFLNNASYQPTDGNGFFIQASLNTLTDLGDWYYDKAAKRLYMHFGTDGPSSHPVRISTFPILCQFNNQTSVTFQNITFEGANRELINSNAGHAIKLLNCGFQYSFNGISADNGMTDFTIEGGYIHSVLNNGIFIPQMGINILINSLNMDNIGTIPGAGGSGDAMQLGIWIQGNNLTVNKCKLTSIGYHGIVLYGNNTLCNQNYINRYGLSKDDCGAIYEFQLPGVTHTNKVICNNIILNGIGVPAGAPSYEPYGQAAGIYLDADVTNVIVRDNVLANGNWGGVLLIGVGEHNQIVGNLAYNFAKCLFIYTFKDQLIRTTTILTNKWVARTADQCTLGLQMYVADNPALFGTFDNNIYARPVNDTESISINQEYEGGNGVTFISLATWRSSYAQDLNSSSSKVTSIQPDDLRFDYNNTDQDLSVSLDNIYTDVSNTLVTSRVNLGTYTGSILVKKDLRGQRRLPVSTMPTKIPVNHKQLSDSTFKVPVKSNFALFRPALIPFNQSSKNQSSRVWGEKDSVSGNLSGSEVPFTGLNVKRKSVDKSQAVVPIHKSNSLQSIHFNANQSVDLATGNPRKGWFGSSDIHWQADGNQLRNLNTGGVVIGQGVKQVPPGYQLYVSDGILTEKVKVALRNTNDWSDKVFGPTYRMRTLSEVEQYIRLYGHLPGIPSANQVVQQGVDLGQMNAKLLEKIEELTLYLISQRKDLMRMHKQMHRLKKLAPSPKKRL